MHKKKMSDIASSGEGHALPGPPPRAQVHRSPLQGQETQLHRRVHQGRHFEGNHQENGEMSVRLQTYESAFFLHSECPEQEE